MLMGLELFAAAGHVTTAVPGMQIVLVIARGIQNNVDNSKAREFSEVSDDTSSFLRFRVTHEPFPHVVSTVRNFHSNQLLQAITSILILLFANHCKICDCCRGAISLIRAPKVCRSTRVLRERCLVEARPCYVLYVKPTGQGSKKHFPSYLAFIYARFY